MVSRITGMAVTEIESRQSIAQMERELSLQAALKEVNAQLEAHIGEVELLLEVSKAISSSIDLPEQVETLGKQVCARRGVSEFSVMLLDDATHELVIEAAAGEAASKARGARFHLGEGIGGEAAAKGETIYVPDVEKDLRYVPIPGRQRAPGALLSVPLRSKGRVLGVMNLNRPRIDSFTPPEPRLPHATPAPAALSIAGARLYQETLELSFTDALTGVPNRPQLSHRLEQELSRPVRFRDPLSLSMVHLAHFTQLTAKHG